MVRLCYPLSPEEGASRWELAHLQAGGTDFTFSPEDGWTSRKQYIVYALCYLLEL